MRHRLPPLVLVAVLAPSLLFVLLGSLAVGHSHVSAPDLFLALRHAVGVGGRPLEALDTTIIWQLRAPRALTAIAVGAGLAVAGAIMQALTRNPLADPYLLGVSSGASVGAVAVLITGMSLLLPLAAFAGALLALTLTLGLARAAGPLTSSSVVLAGVVIASMGSALTGLLIFWNSTGDTFADVMAWLLGSLSGSTWRTAATGLLAVAILLPPLVLAAPVLDAFAFGDDTAALSGVNVRSARYVLLALASLLTGAVVSVSGAIGFVGLVLPHAVRMLVGPGHRALLPLSALAGALFLLTTDSLARSIVEPREIPVGIVTALVGAPIFAVLLIRRSAR